MTTRRSRRRIVLVKQSDSTDVNQFLEMEGCLVIIAITLWYNEHKSAHLKSSLRNFICAENRTKLWHNEKISGKSKLTKENGICLQECNT